MRPNLLNRRRRRLKAAICASVTALSALGYVAAGHGAGGDNSAVTETPIKHVIILIGENRGLDHTFGVYKPKGGGQTISNILSKGIVNEDGTPGPNFALAQQYAVTPQGLYYIGAPDGAKTPYNTTTNLMPQPNTNGAPEFQSTGTPPFPTIAEAALEPDIEPAEDVLLTTGATGLPTGVLDTRVPGAGTLRQMLQAAEKPSR